MKKILYGVIAAASLTACDPTSDSIDWNGNTMSATVLEQGIKIEQFNMEESGELTPAPDGNWIKFSTNPSKVVEVYYLLKDSSKVTLSTAKANGLFNLAPSRGSNPNQIVYFKTLEFDGSSVVAAKEVTVQVASELSKEMAIICSNSGTKTWRWNTDGKGVWGNFGYTVDSGTSFAENLSGKWWGVDLDGVTFADQQNHRGSDKVTGDDDAEAYMIIDEIGKITSYDKTGKELRSAKFKIKDYDPIKRNTVNGQAWHEGILNIEGGGGILWPYAINTNGKQPEELEIMRLTATELVLSYAAPGSGSWSEATFWRFVSDTDKDGLISGYDKTGTSWTWDTTQTAFWGNFGYHAGDDWSAGNQGQWWGVSSTDGFADQQQHRGTDEVTGDDNTKAYMTLFPDGTIKTFDADDKEIRSGKWSTGEATVNKKRVATFNTTPGSILWPYAINMKGYQPEQFEMVYLSDSQMALVYAKEGTGDWSEATFWRFIKK